LLQRLLQSLLTLSLGSFPRLPLPPLARLALGILLYQLTDGFQPLLHRWFAPERIHSRPRPDFGSVVHHPFQADQFGLL